MHKALAPMYLLPFVLLQLAASNNLDEACDMANMAECDSTSLLQLTSKANGRNLLSSRSSSIKAGDDPSTLENKIDSATGPTGQTTDTSSGNPLSTAADSAVSDTQASAIAQQAVQDVIREQIVDQLRSQLAGALGGSALPQQVVPVGGVAGAVGAGAPCGPTTTVAQWREQWPIPVQPCGPRTSLVPEYYYTTPCGTTTGPCYYTIYSTPKPPHWPCVTTMTQVPQTTTTINPCRTTTNVDNITVWIDYGNPIPVGSAMPAVPNIPGVPGMPNIGQDDNLPNLTIIILPPTNAPTVPPTGAPAVAIGAPNAAMPCGPTVEPGSVAATMPAGPPALIQQPATVPCATNPALIEKESKASEAAAPASSPPVGWSPPNGAAKSQLIR